MAIELIRLKPSGHDAATRQLLGSVVIDGDGTADFFGDAGEHAELIAGLLDDVNTDVPFTRVRPDDLVADPTLEPSPRADDRRRGDHLRVDVIRIGAERVIGPLLLRRDMPPAVGGSIDDALAAIILRELRAFKAARAARSDRNDVVTDHPIRVAA